MSQASKYTTTQEQAIRRIARQNRELMVDEAQRAKENGVTYGMYKAGITKAAEETSDYSVHQTDTLHRTEKTTNDTKPVATIKRGIRL